MFEAKAWSAIGVNTKTRRRRFAPSHKIKVKCLFPEVITCKVLILEKFKVILKYKPQRRKLN